MSEPNPLHVVLRRSLGVDAFSLDGDDSETQNDWSEKRAKVKLELDPVHEN
jgi:hypothetical protein